MGAKALSSTWKGASNLDRNMIPTMAKLSGSRGWFVENQSRSCLEEAAEGTFSILAGVTCSELYFVGIPRWTSIFNHEHNQESAKRTAASPEEGVQ